MSHTVNLAFAHTLTKRRAEDVIDYVINNAFRALLWLPGLTEVVKDPRPLSQKGLQPFFWIPIDNHPTVSAADMRPRFYNLKHPVS